MKETINFKLKKPEQQDFYNVDDFNSNADIIDAAIKKAADDLKSKADLVGGKVPESQLPSYVSDIVEGASQLAFPSVGKANTIYIALDTGITYRWSGTQYTVISDTIALGETAQTAYRGDRGKTAYEHSMKNGNPHNLPIDAALSIDSVNPIQNKVVAVELSKKGNLKSTLYTNITVPTSAWVTNTCPDFEQEEKIDFPYMAEISIPEVLSTDSGETKYKYADEISGNFGNSATQTGKVVLTAKEKPTESITLLWVRIDRRLG